MAFCCQLSGLQNILLLLVAAETLVSLTTSLALDFNEVQSTPLRIDTKRSIQRYCNRKDYHIPTPDDWVQSNERPVQLVNGETTGVNEASRRDHAVRSICLSQCRTLSSEEEARSFPFFCFAWGPSVTVAIGRAALQLVQPTGGSSNESNGERATATCERTALGWA